jgi:hypothetical protein
MDFFREHLNSFLLSVFLWAGSRLFPVIIVDTPEGEDDALRNVHFSLSEVDFERSISTHYWEAVESRKARMAETVREE